MPRKRAGKIDHCDSHQRRERIAETWIERSQWGERIYRWCRVAVDEFAARRVDYSRAWLRMRGHRTDAESHEALRESRRAARNGAANPFVQG